MSDVRRGVVDVAVYQSVFYTTAERVDFQRRVSSFELDCKM